jgi:hypothetical protein
MTQSVSLTDDQPAAEIAGHAPACLERLEFGKFCVSSAGPVEKNRDRIPIGYSQLGWSAGFPADLISFCDPKGIGISEGDEPLPTDSPHGTVLRPALIGKAKKFRRVFYRVRMRAEEGTDQNGKDKAGRRYTMARYLVAEHDDIDPLMLFNAMDSVPLQGMTRKEASDIPALVVSPAELKPGRLIQAFLREAVIYVLSGIPLSITEEISETDFFCCVTALWRALPPPLRSHLSAGWSVGSSYSGKLAVTHTAHRAGYAALFSPADLTWSRPDCAMKWDKSDQLVRSSFFEERLEPGRLYAQYVFGGDSEQYSVNLSPSSDKVSNLIGSFPTLELSELPDWHARITIQAFRYPGLRARDQLAISLLERWLRTGKGEDEPLFCLDARAFTYQSTQLNALDLMIKALAYPATRRWRGDRALWVSLSGKCPDSFNFTINGASGEGADRARLLAALARHDTLEMLRTLMLAGARGEAGSLSDEVAERLETCLDESIRNAEKSRLHIHAHLLKSPPEQYSRWVRGNALKRGSALNLMRALASMPGDFGEEVYDDIVKIDPSSEVLALREMIEGLAPSVSAKGSARQLAGEQRNIFIDLFNQEWDRLRVGVAGRRERLLGWFDVLKPRNNVPPLLRLQAGEPLSEKDVNLLADEVEQDYIPPSLVRAVSIFVLEHWELIGRRVRSKARQWSGIHATWPSFYARLLVGGVGMDEESIDPAIRQAAKAIKIPFDELNEIIKVQLPHATFSEFASRLWEWAARFPIREGYQPTIIDLCSYITKGELPKLAPNYIYEIDDFARFARASGMADRLVRRSQQLWANVSQDWHLLLLLSLFPNVGFKPSAKQLGWLVQYQDWLNNHPTHSQVYRQRWSDCYLATRPFHSLSFKEDADLWREDFATHSVIWAAFRGVPVIMLPHGALNEALRAYSKADKNTRTALQSTATIKQQTNLCLIFLNSYSGAASEDTAVTRVLFEFVFPLLRYGRIDRQIYERDEGRMKDLFSIVGIRQGLPDYARNVEHPHSFQPELEELLRKIVILRNGRTMAHAISEYYKSIKR